MQAHDEAYWKNPVHNPHVVIRNAHEAITAMSKYYLEKTRKSPSDVPPSDVPSSDVPSEEEIQAARTLVNEAETRAVQKAQPKRRKVVAKLDEGPPHEEDPPAHAASLVPIPAPHFLQLDLARLDCAKEFLGNTPAEDLFLCVVSQVF